MSTLGRASLAEAYRFGDALGTNLTTRRAWLASLSIVVAGQLFLVLIESQTRASGTFASTAGPAILLGDSQMFLNRASSLETVLSQGWTRMGYPALLLLSGQLGSSTTTIVYLQFAAIVSSGALLYQFVHDHVGTIGAFGATAFFAANPMTAQWVRIVTTESIFFSLIVASIVVCLRMLDSLTAKGVALLLFCTSLATVLRPNGFLLLISAAIFLSRTLSSRFRGFVIASIALLGLALLPLAAQASGQPENGSLVNHLYRGVVVHGTSHVETALNMPAPDRPDDETIRAVARYVAQNPAAVARLGATRVIVETLQARRHYPTLINVAFLASTLTYLGFVILGLRRTTTRAFLSPVLVFSLPQVAMVGATFAVPEGRFGWAYLLMFAPIAGGGVAVAFSIVAGTRTFTNRRRG